MRLSSMWGVGVVVWDALLLLISVAVVIDVALVVCAFRDCCVVVGALVCHRIVVGHSVLLQVLSGLLTPNIYGMSL